MSNNILDNEFNIGQSVENASDNASDIQKALDLINQEHIITDPSEIKPLKKFIVEKNDKLKEIIETNSDDDVKTNAELDEFGDVFCKETDSEHSSWLYFKDSRRLFIEKNIEWYFDYSEEDDKEEIKVLDIKQAWDVDTNYFVKISKKYNVDFKLKCLMSSINSSIYKCSIRPVLNVELRLNIPCTS